MKYKIKDQVRIREEDGFYLIVNLTTEDMISGYPAFFKANIVGKRIVDIIHVYSSIDEIVAKLSEYFPSVLNDRLENDAKLFLSTLERYSLVEMEEA